MLGHRLALPAATLVAGAAVALVIATTSGSASGAPASAAARTNADASPTGVTVYHYSLPEMRVAASSATFSLPRPPAGAYLATFHVEAMLHTQGANVVCSLHNGTNATLTSYGSPYPPNTVSNKYYSTTTAAGQIGIGTHTPLALSCVASVRGSAFKTTGNAHDTVELERITTLVRETVRAPR